MTSTTTRLKTKSIALLGAGILMVGLASLSSLASAQHTGTRTGGTSQPVMAIQMNPGNEMRLVARLLQRQEPEKAIKRLKSYLKTVTNLNLPMGNKYQGLNALCTAYIAVGEQEKAIDSCNKAIAIFPRRWQAFNTRGSTYFVSGNLTNAEADFKTALNLVSKKSKYQALVKKNLALITEKP